MCFYIDVRTGECITHQECYRVDGETDILTAEDIHKYADLVKAADLKEVQSFVDNKIFKEEGKQQRLEKWRQRVQKTYRGCPKHKPKKDLTVNNLVEQRLGLYKRGRWAQLCDTYEANASPAQAVLGDQAKLIGRLCQVCRQDVGRRGC